MLFNYTFCDLKKIYVGIVNMNEDLCEIVRQQLNLLDNKLTNIFRNIDILYKSGEIECDSNETASSDSENESRENVFVGSEYESHRNVSIESVSSECESYERIYLGSDCESYISESELLDSYDEEIGEEEEEETDSSSSESEEEFGMLCVIKPRFQIIYHTPRFHPTAAMKEALDKNFSTKILGENSEIFREYLESPELTPNNIHTIFNTLLQIEDLTTLSLYPTLAQNDVTLDRLGLQDYSITLKNIPNLDNILVPYMDEAIITTKSTRSTAEPKYAVDILEIVPNEDIEFSGIVVKVSKDCVHISFSHLQAKRLNIVNVLTKNFDVVFRPLRMPLRYQYNALEVLAKNCEMRQYLFPTQNLNKPLSPSIRLELFNEEIAVNPEQLQAVQYIVAGPDTNAPYLIFGPPGTGKTTTIVEAIIQLRLHQPGSRILVTAGSNSACDTIALRICKYLKSNRKLKQQLKCQQQSRRTEIIRIYSKSIIQKGIQFIDEDLLKHSNYRTGKHEYPHVDEIRRYGVIVATLSTVGKLVSGDVGRAISFTHIFIDEAGASTEPETLVGIMGIKLNDYCRIILSGDHKQLGPVVKSDCANKLGLQLSMMERLMDTNECYAIDRNGNYDRTLQTRLRRNYRSHPEIVRLYNHLYYDSELIAEAKDDAIISFGNWPTLPNPNFPIIFQAVHGSLAKDICTPSSYNVLEIQVLIWYLHRLLIDGVNGQTIKQDDIGIITPYSLQCKRIESRLKQCSMCGIEVGTVEAFQGREKPIIIVSLVRSFSSLGFVDSPRRLNVMLSRAKSLLILLGNPVSFRRNDDFKFIIEECKKNGTMLRKKKIPKNRSINSICLTDSSKSIQMTHSSLANIQ